MTRARGADDQEDGDSQRSAHIVRRSATSWAEGSAAGTGSASAPGPSITTRDRRLVQESLRHLTMHRQFVMEYLYARLFVQRPELRGLFPLSMERARAATFRGLVQLIENLDNAEKTEQALRELGRDHRKFGVREQHYQPFFDALQATVDQFGGQPRSTELNKAWRSVLGYLAATMKAGAASDAGSQPAWWIGEIVQHDQRTPTVAVLTIRPDRPLRYQPGQYVSVQVPRWPRMWRKYSIANAPRENGLIDIHVRAVPDGKVSTALVSHSRTGDILTLAAARGDLRVPAGSDADIVGVAGGTGLAPIKAIIEAVVTGTRQGRRRSVSLYVGARCGSDLYDMRDLAALRLAYPALTLIPVAETDPELAGQTGKLPAAVARHPSFRDTEVYVAGPAGLVAATVRALASRVPAGRFHHDPLDLLIAASHPVAGPGG